MSNQNINKTRRTFLKGAASASALSVGGISMAGISNTAFASIPDSTTKNGITVIQETLLNRESVTLINESGKLQMINVQQPVSLIQTKDSLVVKVNQDKADAANGMLVMSPNERLSFDVKAVGLDVKDTPDIPVLTNLAQNELKITSDNPVFNRIILVDLV